LVPNDTGDAAQGIVLGIYDPNAPSVSDSPSVQGVMSRMEQRAHPQPPARMVCYPATPGMPMTCREIGRP
jgi:hypothetical protein